MKIVENIELDSTIKQMKNIGKSHIFFSDMHNTFYIADLSNGYKLKRKNKIGSAISDEHKNLHMHQFSKGGNFLAINDRAKKLVNIYDFLNKKLHFTISWHIGEIETTAFDNQNAYIATGGQDGKSFLWSLKTSRLTYVLPPHSDFVTSIAFNKTGSWVATGGFDAKVKVTNIYAANKTVELFGSHSGYIKFINFISNNRLVSVDNKGGISVWDYVSGKLIKTLKSIDSEPTSLAFIFDDQFMLVSTKLKTLALYNMNKYELSARNFMQLQNAIVSIETIDDSNLLIIATDTNELKTIDLKSDEVVLEGLIADKKYSEAYKLSDVNPTLHISDSYAKLESIWNKTLSAVYAELEKLNINGAKAIFGPFVGIPAKSNQISNILNDYAEFNKFVNFVETKKYPLAYQLAFKYPSYKDSKYYKNMESEWNTQMNKVKALIVKNEDSDALNAKIDELLFNFRGISSKAKFISEVKQQKTAIKLFRHKLANNDFKIIFKLVAQYPFLKELDDYFKLEQIEDMLYEKAKKSLLTQNHTETLNLAKQLMEFPNLKNEAKEIFENVSKTILFMQHYMEKDYDKMLKIVEEAPFLEETPEFIAFNEKWLKALYGAEKCAAKGDVKAILESFNEFVNISERADKIGATISMVYIAQLRAFSKKFYEKPKLILKFINRYIDIFGKDNSIEALIKYFEIDIKVFFEDSEIKNTPPSLRKWRELTLPDKIYESN